MINDELLFEKNLLKSQKNSPNLATADLQSWYPDVNLNEYRSDTPPVQGRGNPASTQQQQGQRADVRDGEARLKPVPAEDSRSVKSNKTQQMIDSVISQLAADQSQLAADQSQPKGPSLDQSINPSSLPNNSSLVNESRVEGKASQAPEDEVGSQRGGREMSQRKATASSNFSRSKKKFKSSLRSFYD